MKTFFTLLLVCLAYHNLFAGPSISSGVEKKVSLHIKDTKKNPAASQLEKLLISAGAQNVDMPSASGYGLFDVRCATNQCKAKNYSDGKTLTLSHRESEDIINYLIRLNLKTDGFARGIILKIESITCTRMKKTIDQVSCQIIK